MMITLLIFLKKKENKRVAPSSIPTLYRLGDGVVSPVCVYRVNVQKMVMGMPPGASHTYTSSMYMAKEKEEKCAGLGWRFRARPRRRCASHTHTHNYGGPTLVNDYY